MGDDLPTDEELDRLQWTTVLYYLHETNPDNGLVRDKTDPAAPCSIAAVGLALASLPVVVERGVLFRPFAAKMARRRLRFLHDLPAGAGAGRLRVQGLLLPLPRHRDRPAGLAVRAVHDRLGASCSRACSPPPRTSTSDTADEAEVRRLADALYRRADWNWARNGGATLTHGWRPESGFLPYRWEGYDEGLLLYVLGLGSPTYPLPPESYAAFCSTYQWKQLYGRELLYSGPLFTHQLSHLWIDFRGLRDAFMRERGSDYFENSRQATFVQQAYAIAQPDAVRGLRGALLGVHGLRRPRLGEAGGRTGWSGSSSTTSPAAPRSARTTAPSPPGSWSPRCRSPPRSSSRPSAAWRPWSWAASTGRTGSAARSTGRSAWRTARRAGG